MATITKKEPKIKLAEKLYQYYSDLRTHIKNRQDVKEQARRDRVAEDAFIAEQSKQEGILEGKLEGRLEEKLETAKNFKRAGVDIQIISNATGLSLEEIEKL